jgi:hypothetical protein
MRKTGANRRGSGNLLEKMELCRSGLYKLECGAGKRRGRPYLFGSFSATYLIRGRCRLALAGMITSILN